MISEKAFSTSYHSFWREILPWADRAIKFLNLGLTERFSDPIGGSVPGTQRGFVNELAFQVCAANPQAMRLGGPPAIDREVFEKTRRRIAAISKMDVPVSSEIEVAAIEEAGRLVKSLQASFRMYPSSSDITFSPQLPGCGMIDNCEGDVIVGNTLVEIKAGDRHFRISDIRQLLCYCALNRSGRCFEITDVSLVNPRTGLRYIGKLDSLCELMSGIKSAELLDEIIWFISSQDQQV